MHRRTLLVLAAAAGPLVAAPAGAAIGSSAAPLVSWQLVGGFVAAGYSALRPARLAVYPDGRAIADADRMVRLNYAELSSLTGHAVRVLRNPANGRPRPGAPIVADVPDTVLRARDGHGRQYRLQASGVTETRDDHVFPPALYALIDHLTALHERAVRSGTVYRSDTVRLITTAAEVTTGATAWPVGVPSPAVDPDHPFSVTDLHGAAARRAARAFPPARTWQWPLYATPDGTLVRVAWRYLLPREPAQ